MEHRRKGITKIADAVTGQNELPESTEITAQKHNCRDFLKSSLSAMTTVLWLQPM
jgi:hypothetical protein